MIEVRDNLPLIPDETQRTAAAKEAASLFKTDELSKCASFGASVHPRALDYIRQAPVMAIAIMAGGGQLNGGRANKHYAAHKFGQLCERGGRLRDAMAAYGYPLPLRKIHAKALSLSDEDALTGLAKLNPSTLSQIIPDAASRQRRWLSAIGEWRKRLKHIYRSTDHLAEWAYSQISKHRVHPSAAADLADFAGRGDVPINTAWEWPRAEAAARDWHNRLTAGDAKKRFGVMADQIIDFGGHPDHAVVAGYEFIALRTPMAIYAEGSAMRHCVASYVNSVMSGTCSIVSVQQDECPIATLELCNGRVRQIKARFNAKPAEEVRRAATAYAAEVRKAQP